MARPNYIRVLAILTAMMATLIVAGLMASPATAVSAVYTVNSTADHDGPCDQLVPFDSSKNCTLREAINAANNNAGADTINFRTPITAAQRNMSPICEVMKGQMISSPDDTPMPMETTPAPEPSSAVAGPADPGKSPVAGDCSAPPQQPRRFAPTSLLAYPRPRPPPFPASPRGSPNSLQPTTPPLFRVGSLEDAVSHLR